MGENIELLGVKDPLARLRYAEAAIAQGWSRAVLAIQIDTRLHDRQGQAVTNFAQALPPETSDLAQQILKDPYQFDFLNLDTPAKERDVERASSAACATSSSSSAKGSASSAASTTSRSRAKISTSTCSSTTAGCAASSRST